MRRSALYFCFLAAISVVAIACGSSSGGSDNEVTIPSGIYTVREVDGGASTLMRLTATGLTSVGELDLASLHPSNPNPFFFSASGSVYDPSSKSIFGSGYLDETDISYFFRVSASNGKVSVFAESNEYKLWEPILSDGKVYLVASANSDGARYIINYPLSGGTASTPVPLGFSARYPGEGCDLVRGTALQYGSGKAVMLITHADGVSYDYALVKVDLATGSIDEAFELGSSYVYGNTFIVGSDIFMTKEDPSGGASVVKVPAAFNTETLVVNLDYSALLDATHNLVSLSRYTLAATVSGGTALLPGLLWDTSGGNANVLLKIDLSTGVVTKLDTVVGCYYLNATVP